MDSDSVDRLDQDPVLRGCSMQTPSEADMSPAAFHDESNHAKFWTYSATLSIIDPSRVMLVSRDPVMLSTAEDFQCSSFAEVASARFRLDATLQHLVEKKDDSLLVGSDGEGGALQSPFASTLTPLQSPRKTGKSRKRKRKEDTSNYPSGPQQQTFVMKLFDRSVDLAQFDEHSPLYPICRAWINNKPGNRTLLKRERTPTPEPPPEASTSQDDQTFPDVYHMPPPVKDEFCESGNRIPIPLPRAGDILNIHQDPDQAPPPEQLLLDHMVRWKQIRNRWREASAVNERRYTASMNLLQDMFDRNMKVE